MNGKTNAPRRGGRAVGIVLLVLCLCLAIGVRTVFRACGPKEDGSWMHCHGAEMAVFWLGLAMSALSALRLALRGRCGLVADAAVALLAIGAMLVPGRVVSLCMMESMRCQAVLRPAVLVLGMLILIVSAVDAVLCLGRKKG